MNDRPNTLWTSPADRGVAVMNARPAFVACPAAAFAVLAPAGSVWQAMYVAAYRSAVAQVERERAIAIAIVNN